jgi:hypothetical protein
VYGLLAHQILFVVGKHKHGFIGIPKGLKAGRVTPGGARDRPDDRKRQSRRVGVDRFGGRRLGAVTFAAARRGQDQQAAARYFSGGNQAVS